MPLAAGQTLTHYEILGPLGAGGMGEVYRARDTRLEREVAIKVLPEDLADDEERLRRFEREAKTLAVLNHPNVAGIHGVDQDGGVYFLALELVPGEDLARRLTRGPLPLDEALDVCRQIAEGLEAAHEAGVVHRDLKPANVRVTPEGVVKILDFGLAKPVHSRSGQRGTTAAESDSFLLTEEGVVLGTPTYMSPEQARGKPVDRRTDIWAFGCVLYECLTGKRAFGGASLTDTLAAIVGSEPDWSLLPPLPERVDDLLRRALTKDPRRRLRDMGDARIALELTASEPAVTAGVDAVSASPRSTMRVPLSVLLLVLGAGAGFAIARFTPDPRAPLGGPLDTVEPREIHASLHTFAPSTRPGRLAISHDGRSVAWTDAEGIWVRDLADPEPTRLRAGEWKGTWGPCWSPDDSELAYVADGSTWRVPVNGGRPERVVGGEAPDSAFLDWLPDGRFVFGTPERVWVMPADGGVRKVLLELEDENVLAHWHAIFPLEDGGFLGALHRFSEAFERVELFRDGEVSTVFDAGVEIDEIRLDPIALDTGGLIVYDAKIDEKRSIWSVPFSLDDLQATGPAHLEVENAVLPSVAREGSLAYLRVDYEQNRQQMAWMRPGEAQLELFDEPRAALGQLRLSPDGRKVAFTTWKSLTTTVWVRDLDRGLAAPAIQIDGPAFLPLWMDDEHLAISSFQAPLGAFVHSLVGRGEPRHLSEDVLIDTSPDGDHFVFGTVQRDFDDTVFRIVGPGADGPTLGFLDHEDRDRFECFAPDGAWMLYSSQRSGTRQLYLTAFPPGDDEWLITPGETSGVWFSKDLHAIYFVSGTRPSLGSELYRVAVTLVPQVELGVPEVVRQLEPDVRIEDYDGSDRFLVVTGSAPTRSQAVVHTGWAQRAAAR